jgi:hypothetical protein
MKKTMFITTILFIFIFQISFSQDTLQFKNGTKIQVIVKEINPENIKYKKFDNQEGPMITVLKNEVTSIKYANGTIDVLDTVVSQVETPKIQSVPSPDSPQPYYNANTNPPPLTKQDYEAMFQQGTSDAKTYYRGYKGAGTGTFFAALLGGPLLGLIPAVACSSTPPSQNSLGYPNYELVKNAEYKAGYNQEAKKIKSKKVWGNFGIGTLVLLALYLVPSK